MAEKKQNDKREDVKQALQEYRLVPVDEWEAEDSENEIDLVELAKYCWDRRSLIYKVVAIGTVLGLLYMLTAPKNYKAEASLMPEYKTEGPSGASNLLQKYGGLIGIDPGTYSSNSNAIRVQLYPNIAQSLPFQLQLLNIPVTSTHYDTTVTAYSYFRDIHTPGILELLLTYTIKLPLTLKNIAFPKESSPPSQVELDSTVVNISEEKMIIIEQMRERLNVQLNEETGIISVSAEMPEPVMAAKMADKAIEVLTNYLTDYRTEKAKIDLKFAKEQLAKAKERFRKAQLKLAEFRDSNMGSLTATALIKQQSLQSEYDLAFNLYNSLSQQYEQAKLRLQEETPVFKTLQPVQVPIKDTLSGALVLLVSAFLSFIIIITWMIVSFIYQEYYQKIN